MAPARLTRALAAVVPAAGGLASAHELYLRNQRELGHALVALVPFWAVAATATVAAWGLQRAERHALARAVLWAWYAAGFALVAWGFLRALPVLDGLAPWLLDTAAGSLLFAAAALAGGGAAWRQLPPRRVEPALAALALLLVAREAFLFGSRLERPPAVGRRDLARELGTTRAALPNVYHLLLDSFPDELFEPCLAPSQAPLLEGFARYHAVSPARATAEVLPTLFSGRRLPGSPAERTHLGLAGPDSVLSLLRRAGYRTLGCVPRFLYEPERPALDVSVYHDENARPADLAAMNAAGFRRLWLFRTLPLALSQAFARRNLFGLDEDLVRSGGLRLSATAQPLVSRMSFEALLEAEPRLPARGRYTLVHLLLPHNPYRLGSDCSEAGGPTDLKRQTDCTLRLLTRFLDGLRRLGRLEGSVVVVHGDHGAGQVWREGRLVADESAWLRTLLLVKPAGARGALRTLPDTARIADVAPTLLSLVGLRAGAAVEGRALDGAPR